MHNHRNHAMNTEYTHLQFKKSGSQIKESIKGIIDRLNAEISASKLIIAEICKRREIDPKDILEADTIQKVETSNAFYVTPMERSNAGIGAQSILQKLQQDINQIRSESAKISADLVEIDDLDRIAKNIEIDRTFDLDYDELTVLGF